MRAMFCVVLTLIASIAAFGNDSTQVTKIEARQRYPWNGKVDIVLTFEGSSNDTAAAICTYVATNGVTNVAIPVTHITNTGKVSGSGTTWTRHFIWDATADVGEVKIDDIALSADAKLLGGVQLWEKGPYWAECNVDANQPEEYGYYFWWGDTVGYKRNVSNNGWVSVKDGSSFKFYRSNCPTYYMSISSLLSAGYIDATGNLTAAHDAATVHLGSPWRIPTDAEREALINNCTTIWTTCNGVYGRLVTGKGDYASKSIFLPSAGYGNNFDLNSAGSYGYYWSSTPDSANSTRACMLYFSSSNFDWCYGDRYRGQSVRPVRGFDDTDVAIDKCAVTTHFEFDGRIGLHEVSTPQPLSYDASWVEGGAKVKLFDGDELLISGISGTFVWSPELTGIYALDLKIYNAKDELLSTDSIVQVLDTFKNDSVKNVAIRQLQPWNGLVEISYEIVDHLVGDLKTQVLISDVASGKNYNATCFTTTPEYTIGRHRLIWDAKKENVNISSSNITCEVSIMLQW